MLPNCLKIMLNHSNSIWIFSNRSGSIPVLARFEPATSWCSTGLNRFKSYIGQLENVRQSIITGPSRLKPVQKSYESNQALKIIPNRIKIVQNCLESVQSHIQYWIVYSFQSCQVDLNSTQSFWIRLSTCKPVRIGLWTTSYLFIPFFRNLVGYCRLCCFFFERHWHLFSVLIFSKTEKF